jgi:hypothetical protein
MDQGMMTATSPHGSWSSPPSVADTDRIAALTDPVVRNLQITQCYYELSLALGARTGNHANWCTFAVWASKQAGQTIRKEDLKRAFERRWAGSVGVTELTALTALPSGAPAADHAEQHRRIRAAVLVSSSFERAGVATARGNRKVFEEIGREFARFLAAFENAAVFDAGAISAFCAELKPGEPPDGQRYLVEAFTAYYRALFESNPKNKAELLLLANIKVGLHEQTRLQPDIADALSAPVVDPGELLRSLREILYSRLGYFSRLWSHFASWIGLRNRVDAVAARLLERARLLSRMVITEHLMTLGLPGGKYLKLGEDLREEFPETLKQVRNTELLALFTMVDPTPDSLAGTAAHDWSILPERMHYIADMFRCLQEQPDLLLAAPFTPEQVAVLKAGRIPPGRL